MTFYKALLTILLAFLFSISKGQKISAKDLQGSFCTIGLSEIEYFLIFQDSSNFYFSPKSSEFGNQIGTYSLEKINSENVLTLNILPGVNRGRQIIFMIRDHDRNSYLLQLPKKTPSGEIVYKWENIRSKNDFHLYVNKKNNPRR